MPAGSLIAAAARLSRGRLAGASLLLIALLVVAWILGGCAEERPPAATTVIDRAVAVAGDSARFPADAAPTAVALPDRWSETRPGFEGRVWYRAAFRFVSIAPADDLLAVYVERACSNLQVHLNGYLVYSSGRAVEPVSRNCGRPQLVPLPAALVRPGDNALDLQVQGFEQARVGSAQATGGLSRLEIGTQSALRDAHAGAWFWNTTWPQASALVLIGIGCVLLAVGRLHRHEVYFSYLGWLCLGWVLVTLAASARDLPWRNAASEFMLAAAWPVLLALAVQFCLSFAGVRSRLIETLVALQWVLVPLTFVLAGDEWLFAVARVWYVVLGLELAGAMAIYLAVARRQRPADVIPMALLVAAALPVLAVEVAVQWHALPPPAVSPALVFVPLALAALGLRLFAMFARALRHTEAERDRIAGELKSLQTAGDARVEALTAQRVAQVAEAERRRIASDLHDDLGAKLLTIVHTTDTARLPTLAREALEEMRLSVRALAGKPVKSDDAVADWRAETVVRLGQAGILARWDTVIVPPVCMLSSRIFMQSTRILRESITNVIKHSGAERCRIDCRIGDDTLALQIKDDGRGIANDGSSGQGLGTMKRRAKLLNGQCLVESYPGRGVVISLTVPI